MCLSNKDEIFGIGFLTNEILVVVVWRRRKQERAKVVNELKVWGSEIWSDIIWKTAGWDGGKEKENAREGYDGFHGVIWRSADLRHVRNGFGGVEEGRTGKGGIGQFLCFQISFLVWCYPYLRWLLKILLLSLSNKLFPNSNS